jgi:hypothetical protein
MRSSLNVIIFARGGAGEAKIASLASIRSRFLEAWRASVPWQGPLFRFSFISIIFACTFSSFVWTSSLLLIISRVAKFHTHPRCRSDLASSWWFRSPKSSPRSPIPSKKKLCRFSADIFRRSARHGISVCSDLIEYHCASDSLIPSTNSAKISWYPGDFLVLIFDPTCGRKRPKISDLVPKIATSSSYDLGRQRCIKNNELRWLYQQRQQGKNQWADWT